MAPERWILGLPSFRRRVSSPPVTDGVWASSWRLVAPRLMLLGGMRDRSDVIGKWLFAFSFLQFSLGF